MSIVMRSAPAGARFTPPTPDRLAAIDAMVGRFRGLEQRGVTNGARLAAGDDKSTRDRTIEVQDGHPDPAPPDADRLTALENRVTSLETRVGRIEETLRLPSTDTPADGSAPAAAAVQPVAKLDASAIYARHRTEAAARAQARGKSATAQRHPGRGRAG